MSTTVTTYYLDKVHSQLSDRDWQIITTLARVRHATSAQLEILHFGDVSRRRAQQRLRALTAQRIVSRLPRVIGGVRAGSRGHVYALDVAGQRLANQAAGRRPERPRNVGVPYLAHALAITDVYVGLVLAERAGDLALRRFVAEPGAWRTFFGPGGARARLKPDAYVVLGIERFTDYWFVEVDRGTEAVSTLERKFASYLSYMRSGKEQAQHKIFPKVLWLVPDEARAAVMNQVIQRQPDAFRPIFVVALQSEAVARLKQGAA